VSAQLPHIDDLVAAMLAEDLGIAPSRLLVPGGEQDVLDRDVTSSAVVPVGARFEGRVVARDGGVVCGMPIVARVYSMLSAAAGLLEEVEVFPLLAEGTEVAPGTHIMEISGSARAVLAGERSALNALMVLSGIATTSHRWQDEAGERLQVLDTRKTLPGLRALSKYAVRVGGATNHRFGLYDMVLVKDNHVRFAGGITAAIRAARTAVPGLAVEVEADTIEQAIEAATAGADIVLLDNMDDTMMRAAVTGVRDAARKAGHTVLTEASGSVSFERLATLRESGVDRVSSSALSLAPPLDLALDELAG
jgi:nicotinate-nucleotide pyrophosphorylase (carboxylating)